MFTTKNHFKYSIVFTSTCCPQKRRAWPISLPGFTERSTIPRVTCVPHPPHVEGFLWWHSECASTPSFISSGVWLSGNKQEMRSWMREGFGVLTGSWRWLFQLQWWTIQQRVLFLKWSLAFWTNNMLCIQMFNHRMCRFPCTLTSLSLLNHHLQGVGMWFSQCRDPLFLWAFVTLRLPCDISSEVRETSSKEAEWRDVLCSLDEHVSSCNICFFTSLCSCPLWLKSLSFPSGHTWLSYMHDALICHLHQMQVNEKKLDFHHSNTHSVS